MPAPPQTAKSTLLVGSLYDREFHLGLMGRQLAFSLRTVQFLTRSVAFHPNTGEKVGFSITMKNQLAPVRRRSKRGVRGNKEALLVSIEYSDELVLRLHD